MARMCFVASTDLKAARRRDGSLQVDGFAAERHKSALIQWDYILQSSNSTFHLTMHPDECLQRLKTNDSDVSNALIELHKTPPELHQTQVMFTEKIQFISGFEIKDGQSLSRDDVTVFSNSDLLDLPVYLWAFVLFLLLIGFVVARILMLSSMKREVFIRLKKKNITTGYIIRREIGRVWYNSTRNFQLIALLLSVLMFYMVASFLCLYKTNQVVIEKPFYPKTYEQSLKHKTSLAFFYDQFLAVSGRFRDALPYSLRGKLWHKLAASGRQNDFRPGVKSPDQFVKLITHAGSEITGNRSIFIGASLVINMLHTLACASTPGGRINLIYVFADPSEPESLYGYPMSKLYQQRDTLDQRLRLVFESRFLAHHYKLSTNIFDFVVSLLPSSKEHKWHQKMACSHKNESNTSYDVKAIPLSYFSSFFAACTFVWIAAILLNCAQVILHKKKMKIKRKTSSITLRNWRRISPSHFDQHASHTIS